ncbi:MAG: AsmA family protein, partial [Alphaproteobacteria bacterium]
MRIKRIAAIGAALAAAGAVAVYATLSSLEFEDLREIAESEVRQATGRDLKVAGPIDLEISLNPAIALEDVSFANASWGSRPAMVTVKRLELEVSLLPLLLGDVRINRLVLVEPDILLETGPDGVGNWVFGDVTPGDGEDTESPGTLPAFSELAVRDGRAVFRDGKTGREMRLHISGARARAASHTSPLILSLSGAANDTAFKFEGTFGSPAELAAGDVFPLMVIADIAGVRLDVEGQIEAPLTRQILDLSILVKGESLADLGALADAPLPRTGPFSVAAQIHRDGPEIKATGLAIQIGGSDLAGNLRLSLAKARPAVTGKLTADLIDLTDILPTDNEVASPTDPPSFIFPETPLPMETLAAFDGDVSFGAGVLRLGDSLELANVELGLALKDGRLAVQPLSVKLSGGRV